jgi:membrane protein YdbS with pleckstrin-like domain
MQCRQCSAEIPDGSEFCNRCGSAQAEDAPAKPFGEPGGAAPAAEETLWSGRYSLKAAAHLWVLWALWISVVVAAYVLFTGTRGAWTNGLFLTAGFGPGLWMLGQALLRKLTLRYRLTNQRLFTERGLLARAHDELELIRVDDVSVRQNLLQRALDVGTVTLLSTDTTSPRLVIEGIEHPLALKEMIRAQVRARRGRTTFLETL